MFNKIKKILFKCFGKENQCKKDDWVEKSKINSIEISIPKIEGKTIDELHHKLISAGNKVSKVIETAMKVEKKVDDPKEKLKRKLQLIARRTKSKRIRKKNLKRLVGLFSNC